MTIKLGKRLFPVWLFVITIFAYNFQHFLNFILPVSLKWFSILFLAYALFIIVIPAINKFRYKHFDWLYGMYLAFLAYSTAMLFKNFDSSNIVIYLYINLPFACYFLVKTTNYNKHLELFYRINVFFLSIVVFFGIYEYFFAQNVLYAACVQFGHLQENAWPYTKYYRSNSFTMNFVHFSYYGLLLYYIFFANLIKKQNLWSLLLLIGAFLGMATSLGLTAISIALTFSCLYLLLLREQKGKLWAFCFFLLLACAVGVAWFHFKDQIALFERFDIMSSRNDSGHDFVSIADFFNRLDFFGTGSFMMVFEQEYYDAFERFGFLMGWFYLILSFTLYYRAFKLLRYNQFRIYSLPLFLYCLSYVFIGFAHHTIDNSNQIILVFAFIGMLENRFQQYAKLEGSKPIWLRNSTLMLA